MDLNYLKDSFIPYITKIEYTGWRVSGESILPSNRIEFSYETRQDQPYSYESFRLGRITNRLKTILVYGNGDLSMKYNLVYDPSTRSSRSILKKIEQFDSLSSANPLLSTNLEWIQGESNFAAESPWGSITKGFAEYSNGFRMADVTGNGRADIIYACSSCNNDILVLRAKEDGSFGQEESWGKHIKAFRADSQGFQVVDMDGE